MTIFGLATIVVACVHTDQIEMKENHHLSMPEAPYAYEFRSLCLSVPNYTTWLVEKLLGKMPAPASPPVEFIRVPTVESLEAAAHIVRGASFIVNATGLGSQDLREVKDKSLYPIRGQTVLVNAPRFRDENVARCINFTNGSHTVYVIPRARTGHVILGGTFDAKVSSPMLPNPAVTERILKDTVSRMPELLPSGVDASTPDAWRKADVISVNVGIRPAREGGARVELDPKPLIVDGRTVGVIHAYGIGVYMLTRSRRLPDQLRNRSRSLPTRRRVARSRPCAFVARDTKA